MLTPRGEFHCFLENSGNDGLEDAFRGGDKIWEGAKIERENKVTEKLRLVETS